MLRAASVRVSIIMPSIYRPGGAVGQCRKARASRSRRGQGGLILAWQQEGCHAAVGLGDDPQAVIAVALAGLWPGRWDRPTTADSLAQDIGRFGLCPRRR